MSCPNTAVVSNSRAVKHWTDEELDSIRVAFDQSYRSVEVLAKRFGVSPNAVSHMVDRMGIRIVKRRRWSQRDEERLEEMLSEYSVDEVARRTGRSLIAIVVKAKRMKLVSNHRSEWYTSQDTAALLGMNSSTVVNRIKAGTLKASAHNSLHPPRKGLSGAWHIHRDDLKDYVQRHPEDLQGRNVDMLLLVDLLCGVKAKYH